MSAARFCIIAAAIFGLNGCAARRHVAASPPAATNAAQTVQPADTPPKPANSRPAPPVARKPNVRPRAPQVANKMPAPVVKTPTPVAPPASQVPKATAPPAAVTLDLNGLETQLKETDAIGLFTKISLKNQVNDLLDQFREYYQGKSKTSMTELRQSYNLLLLKVLSLLQNKDEKLASAIASSREAIWNLLSDPKNSPIFKSD